MMQELVIYEENIEKTRDMFGHISMELINPRKFPSSNISLAVLISEPNTESKEHYHKKLK